MFTEMKLPKQEFSKVLQQVQDALTHATSEQVSLDSIHVGEAETGEPEYRLLLREFPSQRVLLDISVQSQ